ncbi:macrophage mannose receptor 1-like, partial [Hyalella azteca]|uniref:Macrophage mannose receptor 1-like n=1 Tax=Hyalella azteca TaxID=294128 RepID=A0A979FLZ3_HYAAZ
GGEMVAECPPGYVQRGGTSDCYLFHSGSKRTWYDATSYCTKQNGNLVRIETPDLTGWLSLQIVESGIVSDSSEFWIDARYNDTAEIWYWASNGHVVDLNYIPEDKRPREGDFGVLTTDSTLLGHHESAQYHFICHRLI